MIMQSRKEAIRQYKERKPLMGAYSVRCSTTGRVWVGASTNLEATRNRVWFGLRIGGHIDSSLQAEWNAQGESAFEYHILEKLEDDLHPFDVARLLQRKKNHWMAQLDAHPLL
jgi:hypothetical protein